MPRAGGREPYRPLARRARIVAGLLIAGIAADVAGVVSGLMERSLLADVAAAGIVTTAQADANDVRELVVGLVQSAVFTLTAIAFLLWFYRAYRNLSALGAPRRFGYGWAIGGWFVPFLSLWRPKQIANDIWRESANDDSVPKVFLAWWLAYVAATYLYSTSTRRAIGADQIDELREVNSLFLVSDVISILAGVLALVVVVRTTRAQTARAHATGLIPEEDPRPLWRRRSTWVAPAAAIAGLGLQLGLALALWSGGLESENAQGQPTPHAPGGAPRDALLADDFSSRGVWLLRDTPSVAYDYVDGKYRLLLKENGLWSSAVALARPVDSLSVEADAVLHAGRASTDFYGVSCLTSSRGSYLFGVSPDGYHTIAYDPGDDQTIDFNRLLEDRAGRFGPAHAPNRVRAECVRRGDRTTLTLAVDGRVVATTIHRRSLGTFVGAELFAYSERGGTDVRFDNLIAREASE